MGKDDEVSRLADSQQSLDLRQNAFKLIDRAVDLDDPQYAETRAKLKRMGFDLYTVEPLTLSQAVERDRGHFVNSPDALESKPFGNPLLISNPDYHPSHRFTLTVYAIPILEESEGKGFKEQLEMVAAHSATEIEPHVPNAHATLLPATAIAQLYSGYFSKGFRGALIEPFSSTYALDQTRNRDQVTLGRPNGTTDELKISTAPLRTVGVSAMYGVVVTK